MQKKNFTILYAEDDTYTREKFGYVLKRYFKNIIYASDGQEAIDIYDKENIDVVLVDINMPKKTGLEVASYIRNRDENIPIVVISAHSDREKLLKAVTLKLEDYIIKPIDLNQAIELLQNIINKLQKSRIISIQNIFEFNLDDQRLYYKNSPVELTEYELKLLSLFSSNFNKVYTKDEIYYHIWDDDIENINYGKVRKLISRFQTNLSTLVGKKINLIENNYSVGYSFKL